jgi:DNA segregation ATPase FtsK/SpoIIIE, S-DNA-T family
MEERYSLLAKAGVRHINSYNDLGREELYRRLEIDEADEASGVPEKLPFIVIVADEMADLMMTAGKEVETHIIRLAQKSRAVGIHLILATQKPTVDVITGLIKSNLPARLSFQVASRTDSRVVLDENGADKLLGNGDMLFLWPGTSTLIRGQGTYLSDGEIDRVVDHCSTGEQNFVGELMNLKVEDADGESGPDRRRRTEEARRAVRKRDRSRRSRRARQCVAAAAVPGHRLRPRRQADRLHGRGRYRRPIQRQPSPRSRDLRGGLAADAGTRREPGRRRSTV